jgi:hypothetical protein
MNTDALEYLVRGGRCGVASQPVHADIFFRQFLAPSVNEVTQSAGRSRGSIQIPSVTLRAGELIRRTEGGGGIGRRC